ncbi:hypothetical protein ACEPAG_1858 [Sanghuangporus baumii]
MESSATTTTSTSSNEQGAPLLPQYGFGATYTFDALVEQHHFLYRVHTPKRKGNNNNSNNLSRASSPSGSVRSRRGELHGHARGSASASARSPPPHALSASVSSIRSSESGTTDYFGYHHSPSRSSYGYSYVEEEDGAAPEDAYFLSRKFKEDLTSPDAGRRRRTISTLSTLSGGSGGYSSYIGSEDGSDLESEGSSSFLSRGGNGPGNLSRSTSMMLGHSHSRVRSDSLSSARPGAKRSQSVGVSEAPASEHAGMTYSELVRHLDWTTRSSSPYVTTSFSFFFCLWEAVRRYKLGVKHDVEIAVIDARKVQGRARTALEVLRSVEPEKQDKAYWKWYRFALESQDVLVFGAISGDAIYTSIPLTHILPKLPSYLFAMGAGDAPLLKSISDPREPDPSIEREREREQEREALTTSHLLTKLAWDIGTTLKRPKKKSSKELTPGKPAPRHTSHADFCKALSASFAWRSEAEQIRDATTGAVGLAQLLIEPWFRARCAEFVAYPFGHDEEEEEEGDKTTDSVCLGLAGDGCTLEHSHDSSIQDALFADKDNNDDDETEEEAARREAAAVLSELALSLARWPSTLWYAEHAQTVDALVHDVVSMCVSEAARGMQGRLAWGIALEDERHHQHHPHRARTISGSGSFRSRVDSVSLRSERRGREDTREIERERSPFSTPGSAKHVRLAGEDYSPSPSRKSSLKESPYKPRARSPLGASPILGPAIVICPKSKSKKPEQKAERDQEQEQSWSPSTPPPSPPLNHSLSEGDLRSVTPPKRRSPPPPPPPPPPRSGRRPHSPTRSFSASPVLPSPNASPSSSLLKRSIHRRAESIPGSWPGGDSDSTPPEDRPGSPVSKQQAAAERPLGPRKGDEEEGDLFWDASVREQARRRPLSWAGSGMVLGAGATAAGNSNPSPSSSAESLLRAGGVHGGQAPSSPSPSPSSKKRGSTRAESDAAQTREGLLTEVVSSALGLGAGSAVAIAAAGANAASELVRSGSPLRLDTSPSAGSASTSAESTGGVAERERERPHASGPGSGSGVRHRRHSSHGMPVELELSPVREVEQEDDEVEVDAEGKEGKAKGKGKELGESVESVEERRAVGIEAEESTLESEPPIQEQLLEEPPVETTALEPELADSKARSAPEAQIQQTVPHSTGTGSTTPRSERRRSRSSTLELIPEEDWADWSIVDAPLSSEYPVERQERVVYEETVESEIPLPPSPALEQSERDAAVEAAGRVPEITLSVDDGVRASAEVSRESAAAASVSAAVAEGEGEDEDDNVVDPSHLSLSPSNSVVPESTSAVPSNSTALVDSRVYTFPLFTLSLRDQLVKTRAFLSTFFVLPVSSILSRLPVPTLPLPAPPSLSPMPSPIFEDSDTVGRGGGGSGVGGASVYRRLARFFSLFRIPFIHPHPGSAGGRSFFSRWRRGDSIPSSSSGSGRSMSTILAPPPRWDAPILDSETNALTTGTTMMPDADGAYWDARETSWVVSCFVCGVTAALVLAAVQEHRCETHMLVGNRYH